MGSSAQKSTRKRIERERASRAKKNRGPERRNAKYSGFFVALPLGALVLLLVAILAHLSSPVSGRLVAFTALALAATAALWYKRRQAVPDAQTPIPATVR